MINKDYLPPIFKMSVLCNIQPYYGHLHEWKSLLCNISEEAMRVWDENWGSLIYLGREYKKELDISILDQKDDLGTLVKFIFTEVFIFLLDWLEGYTKAESPAWNT